MRIRSQKSDYATSDDLSLMAQSLLHEFHQQMLPLQYQADGSRSGIGHVAYHSQCGPYHLPKLFMRKFVFLAHIIAFRLI
jgi:hypothetical protein